MTMSSDFIEIRLTAFDIASSFLGIKEIPGEKDHPLIVWWLSLCKLEEQPDETPWCSAFVNGVCWLLRDWRIPRTDSARARSWLKVGKTVPLFRDAEIGWDIVILKRGPGPQPGPEIINAPGHVGFFAGFDNSGRIKLLGGNQSNAVNIQSFSVGDVIGIRRLRG